MALQQLRLHLLGVIIERVTGHSYADYLDEHVFGPLDMHASSYCDEKTIIPNRAERYERLDGKLVNDDPISMNVPGAAGAVCSSVSDLLKWQRATNERRLVSESAYERMTTPTVLNNDSSVTYGYGLEIREMDGRHQIAHGGGINGFVTMLAYYPDDELTVVALSNTPGPQSFEHWTPSRIFRGAMAQQIASWGFETQ